VARARRRIAPRCAWHIAHLFLHIPVVPTGYNTYSREKYTRGEREGERKIEGGRRGGGKRDSGCMTTSHRPCIFCRSCGLYPRRYAKIMYIIMQLNIFAIIR